MVTEKDFIKGLTDELLSVDHFSRKDVFDTFSKYIDNKGLLQKCIDIGDLHFDYVKYHTIFQGTLFEDGILEIVKLAKQAFQTSPEETARVLTESYIGIASGLAHYTQTLWSASWEIDEERPDVFIKTAFTRMGDMIENSLKPYLFMINEFRCIAAGNVPNQKKLGAVVDVVINMNPVFKSLYSDLLLGITVSQWRNISDHGDYKYTSAGVEVEYGPENNRKKKMVAQDELRCLLVTIDNLLYMNKMARTLLSIEYYGHYSAEAGIKEKTSFTQKDDQMMQIVETSYAYGFIITKLSRKTRPYKIELDQKFGSVSRKELEEYLRVMSSIVDGDFSYLIYRKGKVEYTANLIDRKLIIMKYIVKA